MLPSRKFSVSLQLHKLFSLPLQNHFISKFAPISLPDRRKQSAFISNLLNRSVEARVGSRVLDLIFDLDSGKVRGQALKVAKQDEKKKPGGRAYKRMQYNRHFVTAVVGFGKKRRPNSSAK